MRIFVGVYGDVERIFKRADCPKVRTVLMHGVAHDVHNLVVFKKIDVLFDRLSEDIASVELLVGEPFAEFPLYGKLIRRDLASRRILSHVFGEFFRITERVLGNEACGVALLQADNAGNFEGFGRFAVVEFAQSCLVGVFPRRTRTAGHKARD